MERLSRRRPSQNDDSDRRGIHPALPAYTCCRTGSSASATTGFWATAVREEKLAVCRCRLLGMPPGRKRQRRTGDRNRLPRPLRRPHGPFAPPMSPMLGKATWWLSRSSRGGPPNLRKSWIPHDSQRRFRTRGERVLVFRHHRRGARVSRIRSTQFSPTRLIVTLSGRHSHVSNGPCAHVPGPHAPSAPSLADGNGPFKTHRPNYRGAVQSNPSLAHRRGVQDFLSPDNSVAAPPT